MQYKIKVKVSVNECISTDINLGKITKLIFLPHISQPLLINFLFVYMCVFFTLLKFSVFENNPPWFS